MRSAVAGHTPQLPASALAAMQAKAEEERAALTARLEELEEV